MSEYLLGFTTGYAACILGIIMACVLRDYHRKMIRRES